MQSRLRLMILLALVVIPVFFMNLGTRDVYKIQEVRIAETAREMLVADQWIVPTYNGELRLQKPPLPYWMTMLSYKAFGVHEYSVRIPAAIFGLLTVMLIFLVLSRLTNPEQAFTTALVFSISFMGMRYFRSGEADAALIFFVTLSALSGYLIAQGLAGRWQVMLFYLGVGLGFLTKGPAAIAIPVLTTLAFSLWNKDIKQLKPLLNVWGFACFILLAFGWYGWIWWQMPDIAHGFVSKQMDETFISGTHIKPVYWYLQHALDFYFPWSLFLFPAAWWTYRHESKPALMRFSLVWLGVVFLLLTWTVNKQVQYALLFSPSLAIWLGFYLQSATAKWARFNQYVLSGFGLAATLGLVFLSIKNHDLWVLAGLGAVLIAIWKFSLNQSQMKITAIALLLGLAYIQIEVYQSRHAEKTDIPELMQEAGKHSPLYQLAPGDGAISFYAGKTVSVLSDSELPALLQKQGEIWLVVEGNPTFENLLIKRQWGKGEHRLLEISGNK